MNAKRKDVIRATLDVLRALWDCIALWGMMLLVRSLSDEGARIFVDGLQDHAIIYTIQGDIDSELECIRQDIAMMSKLREN